MPGLKIRSQSPTSIDDASKTTCRLPSAHRRSRVNRRQERGARKLGTPYLGVRASLGVRFGEFGFMNTPTQSVSYGTIFGGKESNYLFLTADVNRCPLGDEDDDPIHDNLTKSKKCLGSVIIIHAYSGRNFETGHTIFTAAPQKRAGENRAKASHDNALYDFFVYFFLLFFSSFTFSFCQKTPCCPFPFYLPFPPYYRKSTMECLVTIPPNETGQLA